MSELAWGSTIDGWRLSASLDRPVFQVDEPVRVSVVFQNTADRPLPYGAQSKDFDYDLDCRDEAGKQVTVTRFGQRMMDNRGLVRYISSQVSPGGQLVNEISVSRHLDLTLAGKYTLTVARFAFPDSGQPGPRVVSNTVSFEIKE